MGTKQARSKLSRLLDDRSGNHVLDRLEEQPGENKDRQAKREFQKSSFARTTKAKLSARTLEGGTDAQRTVTPQRQSEEENRKQRHFHKDAAAMTTKSSSNLSARSLDGLSVNQRPQQSSQKKIRNQFSLKLQLGSDRRPESQRSSGSEGSRSEDSTTSQRSDKLQKASVIRLGSHKTQRSQMAGTDIDPEPAKVFYCWECFDATIDPSTVGFCVECNDYLCYHCINIHRGKIATKKHTIFAGRDMEQILKSEGYRTDSSDSEPEQIDFLKEVKLVRECTIMAPEDKEKCTIHSATVLGDGSVILCDIMNNNLKHFDVKFRLKSVLDLGSGPRDICTSNINHSEAYVTLNGFHAFFQINTKPTLENTRSIDVGGECYGITCWKLGVAVTSAVKKFAEGTLELFLLDYEGHTLRRVQKNVYDKYEMYFDDYRGKDERKRHHEIGKMQFDLPWYLTSDEKGQRILVSDYGNHTITSVNVDGKVEYQIDDVNLNGPTGIATDEDRNLYIVGQRSHNVYQMTSNREKLGQILTRVDGLEYPGAIIYNPVNKTLILQISGWSDKIQIYKLD